MTCMTPQEDVDDAVIHPGSVARFSILPELAEMRTPIYKHATRQSWPIVASHVSCDIWPAPVEGASGRNLPDEVPRAGLYVGWWVGWLFAM
jgi:hypothetical protein